MVCLLLILVFLHKDGAFLISAYFNGSLAVVILDVNIDVLIKKHDQVLLYALLSSEMKWTSS